MTGANRTATASLRAEDMTLEQRDAMAREIGDRVGGPYTISGPAPKRRTRLVHTCVEEMRWRRPKLEGRARLQVDDRPSPGERYSDAEIEALGKQGMAHPRKSGGYHYPIASRTDLQHAIKAFALGRYAPSERLDLQKYIVTRARELKATGLLPSSMYRPLTLKPIPEHD